MVWHDDILLIEGEKKERSIRRLYESKKKKLYKAYDEGNKIIAILFDTPYENYRIIQLDLASNPVVFSYGYAFHSTPKDFEKDYDIPFTEKALASFNRNPEFIKYLPKRGKDKTISYAFVKGQQKCTPLSTLEYWYQSIKLFLINILSAG